MLHNLHNRQIMALSAAVDRLEFVYGLPENNARDVRSCKILHVSGKHS
jgi:hypothetical protein